MAATLAYAIENNFLIRLFCDECNRCRTFDPGSIADVLGAATTIPALGQRCRCEQCGARQITAQVAIRYFNTMPVEQFGAKNGRNKEAPPLHAGAD